MMFCPKCGSLLRPKTEKGKKVLYCGCGYSTKDVENTEIKETIKKSEHKIEVVPEDEKILPLTDEEVCPRCGHKKAYHWSLQIRAGDEPETKFFKCEKCKHTWKENS